MGSLGTHKLVATLLLSLHQSLQNLAVNWRARYITILIHIMAAVTISPCFTRSLLPLTHGTKKPLSFGQILKTTTENKQIVVLFLATRDSQIYNQNRKLLISVEQKNLTDFDFVPKIQSNFGLSL